MTTNELLLGSMGIAMYANPFLLLFAWIGRLCFTSRKTVREWIGWISLGLASAGFLAFICFVSLGASGSYAGL